MLQRRPDGRGDATSDEEDLRAAAEGCLDEMPAAEAALDHARFTRRFEPRDVEHFGESRFGKDLYAIREDLGNCRSREHLGTLKGFVNADRPDRHPGAVRHVWRGVFERNETLVVVGVHEKDGTVYVDELTCHH